ncbi:MAG TPA: hypothetical protein VKW78_19955 [Terriglobales bacterium]|nr:hypothetical protein [Terriglobales bacterium]
MLDRFLLSTDAERASNTLLKLARHDISAWAITGGLAVEIHLLQLGHQCSVRALNDIDFLVDSFCCVPQGMAPKFLFRHIHPEDPPGKVVAQFVDAGTATRVDVFRCDRAVMARTFPLNLGPISLRIVSLEDLVARHARILLGMAEGKAIPNKHATDFLRLRSLVNDEVLESVWQSHRNANHPSRFTDTVSLLEILIDGHPEQLITQKYSTDVDDSCSRCRMMFPFQLADPKLILSLLGYC